MTPSVRDKKLARLIEQHVNTDLALAIVEAAHKTGVALSLACALAEQESGMRNVFGHDPMRLGANRMFSGKPVTHARYRAYKAGRRVWGNQGVGIVQLTSPGYQDAADRIGGCYHTRPNLEVGLRAMRALIEEHGEKTGIARYNGSGPNAVRYASQVLGRKEKWHNRFDRAGLT